MAPPVFMRVERLAAPLFAVGFLATAAVLIWPIVAAAEDGTDIATAKLVAFCSAGLALLILWHFERMTLILTADELVVGFKILRKRVKLRDLARVTVVRARFPGIGDALRRGLGWNFVTRFGPALHVVRKDGMPLLIACGDPDSVLAALAARGVPKSIFAREEGV